LEVEAEETETVAVAVKTAEVAEMIETVAVTITMVAVMITMVAVMIMTVAVTERAAVVYRRKHWFVSNVSDVRIMWNITPRDTMAPSASRGLMVMRGLEAWCCIGHYINVLRPGLGSSECSLWIPPD
jgi:hypothetical protein